MISREIGINNPIPLSRYRNISLKIAYGDTINISSAFALIGMHYDKTT